MHENHEMDWPIRVSYPILGLAWIGWTLPHCRRANGFFLSARHTSCQETTCKFTDHFFGTCGSEMIRSHPTWSYSHLLWLFLLWLCVVNLNNSQWLTCNEWYKTSKLGGLLLGTQILDVVFTATLWFSQTWNWLQNAANICRSHMRWVSVQQNWRLATGAPCPR